MTVLPFDDDEYGDQCAAPDGRPAALTLRCYLPDDEDDRQAVAAMYADYLREGFRETGEAPPGAAVDLRLDTILSCWEGDVVGFASVHTAVWEVDTLYVAPAHRRRGVARALLTAVDRWARGQDRGRGVKARVPVSPAADALLAELGIPKAEYCESDLDTWRAIGDSQLDAIRSDCEHGEDWPADFCTPCYDGWAQQGAEAQVQRHQEDVESLRRMRAEKALRTD
ncbi:GNAT family N-acetyltransferase [Streptomyces sp. NPDC058623]|uniref:GNAT family N-acetyltransferase n=1 Tax=Streptomyces sp. NPDC058623 TaxID=3346563 RepID=UPI00364CC5B4